MDKLILNFVENDGFDRPVYESDGKLFVDVEPRKDKEPNICTVYGNVIGGEPDTPISYMNKYKDIEIEFLPKRITW